MAKDIKNYQDADGFVGHYDPRLKRLEYGDCGQRTGTLSYLTDDYGLAQRWTEQCKLENEWVRYPEHKNVSTETLWYCLKGTMSYDNFIPIVIASHKNKDFLKDAFIKLFKRCGFLWNTRKIWSMEEKYPPIPDFGGPTLLIAFIRAYKGPALFLLPFLDLWLVISTLARYVAYKIDHEDTGNDLNHSLVLIQAYQEFPTYLSTLAFRIYFKLCDPILSWKNYFESTDAPPLDELAIERLWQIHGKIK